LQKSLVTRLTSKERSSALSALGWVSFMDADINQLQRIGQKVLKRLQPFGCKELLYFDYTELPQGAWRLGGS
jgi:phosphoglycerate dehydrogenase-like enzyme